MFHLTLIFPWRKKSAPVQRKMLLIRVKLLKNGKSVHQVLKFFIFRALSVKTCHFPQITWHKHEKRAKHGNIANHHTGKAQVALLEPRAGFCLAAALFSVFLA